MNKHKYNYFPIISQKQSIIYIYNHHRLLRPLLGGGGTAPADSSKLGGSSLGISTMPLVGANQGVETCPLSALWRNSSCLKVSTGLASKGKVKRTTGLPKRTALGTVRKMKTRCFLTLKHIPFIYLLCLSFIPRLIDSFLSHNQTI